MVRVLAFDVDGVLTCGGCSTKRRQEQLDAVRSMLTHARRNGYKVAVNTARTYGVEGIMETTTLSGVHSDLTNELVRANGGEPVPVCYRPSGMRVAERKMECLSQLADKFRMNGEDDNGELDRAILVEDNTVNYSRAGSLLGRRGSHGSPEGDMLTAGVLVPQANGVTAESGLELVRAMDSQNVLARKVRYVLSASLKIDAS